MKRLLIWGILFVFGLIMILCRAEISRYISDMTALLAAGIALTSVSGIGLLLELYGKKHSCRN